MLLALLTTILTALRMTLIRYMFCFHFLFVLHAPLGMIVSGDRLFLIVRIFLLLLDFLNPRDYLIGRHLSMGFHRIVVLCLLLKVECFFGPDSN